MKRFVVLAACVCVSRAQFAIPASAPSTQFHAQDEFGQFSFGHAGGPSAKTESRNAYGVTTGSYQYIDANGLLQTVNYVADPVNGFRVAATNLPVGPAAPAAPEVAPLVAPVFEGVQGEAQYIEDTAEVAAAKAEFQAAFDAATAAAAAERKKREADPQVVLGGLPYAGLPYAAAALPAAVPALAPVGAVAHAPVVKSDVITPAEVSHEVAAAPIVTYAHPAFYGKRSADADPQVLAGLPYAGLPYAAATLPAALPAFAPVGAVAKSVTVKSDVITPAEVSHEVAAAPIVTYAHPYGHAFYGKRSADEAAPAVVAAPTIAGLPYPYAAGLPLNYAAAPVATVAGLPLNYAAAPAVAAPVATVAAAAGSAERSQKVMAASTAKAGCTATELVMVYDGES